MRALHLHFRLHRPYRLNAVADFANGYFGGETEFREANQREYQPFLAVIERNTQRYKGLKISLGVSGIWLEQAAKWDPELLRRLKRLVEHGQLEILATPFNHSLSCLYDLEAFSAEVTEFRLAVEKWLGANCQVLALPELIYHDPLAAWANAAGFKGILIGAAEDILDYRSTNQPFFAALPAPTAINTTSTAIARTSDLQKLRLLCQNTTFSNALLDKTPLATALGGNFSAQKFQKELELEALRGNLITLCLDPSIFHTHKDAGIVRFFDDFFAGWLKNNRFVTASEALDLSPAKFELSVKKPICRTGALSPDLQKSSRETALYALRPDVLRTKDRELYRIFGRLTDLAYALDEPNFDAVSRSFADRVTAAQPSGPRLAATADGTATASAETADFSVRVQRVQPPKKPQKPPVSDDSISIPVHRLPESAKPQRPATKPAPQPDIPEEARVIAERLTRQKEALEQNLGDLAEAELVEISPE